MAFLPFIHSSLLFLFLSTWGVIVIIFVWNHFRLRLCATHNCTCAQTFKVHFYECISCWKNHGLFPKRSTLTTSLQQQVYIALPHTWFMHTMHVIKMSSATGGYYWFNCSNRQRHGAGVFDESDDSDVDESLQYSVKMTPAYHALLHSKQWLINKVYYEKCISL